MLWRQPFSPDSPFCFDLFLAVAFNWGLGLFFDNLPPENFPFTQNRQKSTAVTKADQHFSTSFFFFECFVSFLLSELNGLFPGTVASKYGSNFHTRTLKDGAEEKKERGIWQTQAARLSHSLPNSSQRRNVDRWGHNIFTSFRSHLKSQSQNLLWRFHQIVQVFWNKVICLLEENFSKKK